MSEVSCRAFTFFTTGASKGLFDVDALLAGLPVTRAELEDPTRRVPWDLWAELCDRAFVQLGSDVGALRASGEITVHTGESGFNGHLGSVASVFTTPYEVGDLLCRWGVPSLYRSMEASAERLPGGRFRVLVQLKQGYRPCEAWFQILQGAIVALPRLFGWADAVVEIESIGPTHGSYAVTPAPIPTWRGRLSRTWRALRASQAVVSELAHQEQELSGTLETLRQQEGGFRAALDALPGFVVLHEGGRIVYANPAVERAIGTEAGELVGARVERIVHADDRARLADELLAPGAVASAPAPLRFVGRSGAPIFVEALALPPFDFGRRKASGLFAVDVSDRVRAEETNRVILASMPDLVVRFTQGGVLVEVEAGAAMAEQAAALRALVGASAWELEGKLPGLLGDHLERGRRALDAALTTGVEQRIELTLTSPDDEEHTYELRVVPPGAGVEVLALVRDLTVQRRTERQLAISERMASVGTLAAGVAHEINNPLSHIMVGHYQLAKRLAAMARGEPVDVAMLQDLVAEVSESTERVRDIVASLKTFSRVDSEAPAQRIDPESAFEQALAVCASELRHRGALERRFTEVPAVMGVPSRLVQVLVNLLVNAAHALEEPGLDRRIIVATHAHPDGRVCLEVSDNGVGIAPELRRRIFDPFFTTKPPGKGTGLGLAISHRLVHEMGGEIVVESQVGRGSTFTVLLPAASAASSSEGSSVVVPAGDRARVLVIDDEPRVARAVCHLLDADGHETTAVASAEEALEAIGREGFDLVLCDLVMPGMSGATLFARAKEIAPDIARRFAFITGGALTASAREAVERAEVPVLAKPPEIEALRKCVASALAGRADRARRSRAAAG